MCVCAKEREREKERKKSLGLYHRHIGFHHLMSKSGIFKSIKNKKVLSNLRENKRYYILFYLNFIYLFKYFDDVR